MNINVPKSMLPDCAVGETVEMTITGEDGDSFIVTPYAKEEAPAPEKPAKAAKKSGPKKKAVAKALETEDDGY